MATTTKKTTTMTKKTTTTTKKTTTTTKKETTNKKTIKYLPDNADLDYGDNNETVTILQTILKALDYYKASIDTYYGTVTKNAVTAFQKKYGLKQDGYAGPVTCKKLNEVYKEQIEKTSDKKKNEEKKKVYVDDFTLDNTHPLTYTFELIDEIAQQPDTDLVPSENLENYKTSAFAAAPTWNCDGEGLTNEVSLQLLYTVDLMMKLHEYQKCKLVISDYYQEIYTVEGYISNIKISHDSDKWKIDLNMTGYNNFLNMTVENYNQTCLQSEHLTKLIEMAGLVPDLQLDGLPDESVTINVQAQSTTGDTSGGPGAGATKTLDEVYQMAAQFSYGGYSTGDPEEAWKAYERGQRSFDCYGCSSFLFYCLKNFAKIPCRIVQGYSPCSDSNTHRVVQIKENGEWHCPKQAWSLTSWLRPFTPEDRYALHVWNGMQWDGDTTTATTDTSTDTSTDTDTEGTS